MPKFTTFKTAIAAVAATLLAASATAASAATIDITAREVGGNIVMVGTGTADLAGATLIADDIAFPASSNSSNTIFFAGIPGGIGDGHQVSNFVSYTPLGAVDFSVTPTGDVFGFQRDNGVNEPPSLILNPDYLSGEQIDFRWTVPGATFASLNLNFGTVGQYGSSTINLVQSFQVPLPAPILLLLSALGGLGLLARRRRLHAQPG